MRYILFILLLSSCGYDKACDYNVTDPIKLYYSEADKGYCWCVDPPGENQRCIYQYRDDFLNKKINIGSIKDHKPIIFSDSCEAKGAIKEWMGPDTPSVKLREI